MTHEHEWQTIDWVMGSGHRVRCDCGAHMDIEDLLKAWQAAEAERKRHLRALATQAVWLAEMRNEIERLEARLVGREVPG